MESQFSLKLLRAFCPSHLLEEIEGDLLQKFESDLNPSDRLGRSDGYWKRKANRRLLWNVIRYFRLGIVLRNKFFIMKNLYFNMSLLNSYLIMAWRNIVRYRWISSINIIGLSASMSICLLILMMIKHQTDFDSFHPDADRLYRLTTKIRYNNGDIDHYASTPGPLISYLQENFSLAEETVSIERSYFSITNPHGEVTLTGIKTSPAFFSLFGFAFRKGSPSTALVRAYSIVLSEESATKLFGENDALGKIVSIKEMGDFTVTGVLARQDKPSHLDFDAYAMYPTNNQENNKDWSSCISYSYIRIKQDVKQETMQNALKLSSVHASNILKKSDGINQVDFNFQSIHDVPFSDLAVELGFVKSWKKIAGFVGLAFVMLLLAIFNYSNVTVARTLGRMKEIGVRKISGASRSQITFQLITESILIALISLVFAVFAAQYFPLNPAFQRSVPQHPDVTLMGWFLLFSIFAGCMTGFFPAMALSKINPVIILKNRISNTRPGHYDWHNGIIVAQFFFSLVFISVLSTVYKQSLFQVNSDYGFKRKNIIHINLGEINRQAFMNELEKRSEIESISASSQPMFSWGDDRFIKHGTDSVAIECYAADNQFIPTYGLQMISGTNFPDNLPNTQERFIILNESALVALKLGSPTEAIGKSVESENNVSLIVIGVLKDFHAHPFKHDIQPLALRYVPEQFKSLTVKSIPSKFIETEEAIKQAWAKVNPNFSLEYSLFEDEFREKQFHGDDLKMLGSVALIAMIIACMGLSGVVMYRMQQRIKEIGIRKVMGANIHQVFTLLSWDFFKLLLLAAFLALPLCHWLNKSILQGFAYKPDIGIDTYGLSFIAIVMLGLLIISAQTIKATLHNPVNILKHE